MRMRIDISKYLEDYYDGALPYMVKLDARDCKIDIDIDVLNPADCNFSIKGEPVDYKFHVLEDGRLLFTIE